MSELLLHELRSQGTMKMILEGLGLTQELSQTLITSCPLRPLRLVYSYFCVSPKDFALFEPLFSRQV